MRWKKISSRTLSINFIKIITSNTKHISASKMLKQKYAYVVRNVFKKYVNRSSTIPTEVMQKLLKLFRRKSLTEFQQHFSLKV